MSGVIGDRCFDVTEAGGGFGFILVAGIEPGGDARAAGDDDRADGAGDALMGNVDASGPCLVGIFGGGAPCRDFGGLGVAVFAGRVVVTGGDGEVGASGDAGAETQGNGGDEEFRFHGDGGWFRWKESGQGSGRAADEGGEFFSGRC